VTSPYLVAPEEVGTVLGDEPTYRARQLVAWLYRHPVMTADRMSDLPQELRGRLKELWPFAVEVEQTGDEGATRKWLLRAGDGASIEAVLMGYGARTTVCISSQAGCAMACTFCATGQFGFERHLDAGEITAQVAFAEASLDSTPMPGAPGRVNNIVFMGMGEPLANYRNVRESLRRMIEVMGRSARSITVSTVGVVPAIYRLAAEPWPVNLAVSLHAADDELRSTLVPLNERYPIEEVVAACRAFFEAKGRRVSIEWTLIAGVNDSREQAAGLAAIAERVGAHVNVIALNPTPLSALAAPAPDTVAEFVASLRGLGTNVTVRATRGSDIDAACGQLRSRTS
jgi:23S rRNA (adenine2503-C2)-methyltransferase